MSELEIEMFACLSDNYGFLFHDRESGQTATVDTPDATVISEALARRGWRLTHILNTHHHMDHAGGNITLKRDTACRIVGPRNDADRIPGIDDLVGEGDQIEFGSHRIEVFEVPGHTRGHLAYFLPDDGVAFVGDALFAMGCGRVFEGTAEQMWHSLQKIMRWPDDTRIYCAHEYTLANGRFAVSVEPSNQALLDRVVEVQALVAAGQPTVPTTVAQEKATNPFLRPASKELRETVGLQADSDEVAVFAQTRALKDKF